MRHVTMLSVIAQLRQLLGQCHGRQQAHQPWSLGYGGTRRLRPIAPAVLSADRRLPHLFLHRQPTFL